jgi:hypothetical protein
MVLHLMTLLVSDKSVSHVIVDTTLTQRIIVVTRTSLLLFAVEYKRMFSQIHLC